MPDIKPVDECNAKPCGNRGSDFILVTGGLLLGALAAAHLFFLCHRHFFSSEFKEQLSDIIFALEQNVDIRVEPMIGKGNRVIIKPGSLQGQEGWVEDRFGMTTVLLRLDFIGQAAAIKVDASILELI